MNMKTIPQKYQKLFDEGCNRIGTDSYKWDTRMSSYGTEDVICMGTADMDFASPQEVLDAICSRAASGALGYTMVTDRDYAAVIGWMKKRYQVDVKPESIVLTPGVVDSLAVAVSAFSKPGSEVAILTPIYPPYYSVIESSGRKIRRCPLIYSDNKWTMDLDCLEKAFQEGCRLMLLCSPHNPIGRVWNMEELNALHLLAEKYGVTVVSDEIHADIIMPGFTHTPWITVDPKGVTLISASKTFNLAGLRCSSAILPEKGMHDAFEKDLNDRQINGINMFGILAQRVAYTECEEWLDALLLYLDNNRRFAVEYMKEHRPDFQVSPMEGTYLFWLDMRSLGLEQQELLHWCVEHGVGLVDGTAFGGEDSKGFMRMNIGAPLSTIQKAMIRFCD